MMSSDLNTQCSQMGTCNKTWRFLFFVNNEPERKYPFISRSKIAMFLCTTIHNIIHLFTNGHTHCRPTCVNLYVLFGLFFFFYFFPSRISRLIILLKTIFKSIPRLLKTRKDGRTTILLECMEGFSFILLRLIYINI